MTHRIAARAAATILLSPALAGFSQSPRPDVQDEVRRLNAAMNKVQIQLDQSQRELAELRKELSALQESGPSTGPAQDSGPQVAELAAAVAEIQDTQSIHATQIATLEQVKVESESKYPLKLNGLVLMTGFVNTQKVDSALIPTVAEHGPGSTAVTVQQTMIGLDARGPHLFGAGSHADLSMDFAGGDDGADYLGNGAIGTPRLRTAHAELDWVHSNAYFALDRTLINPNAPTSLTAVAQPPLAWSGNLWAWNPQAGVSHDFLPPRATTLRAQAALIDVADPAARYLGQQVAAYTPSTAQQSRWPGAEARLALLRSDNENGLQLGASGYFAPHRASWYYSYDSWAGALDFNTPITRNTQLTANAYRGLALGGLGGGAYKDFVMRLEGNERYFRALDDVGGWVQWKQNVGERLEFNEAFGIDNVPAHQLRPFTGTNLDNYYNLARNRTITGNFIYSPSAYLLFSLEYRRIASSFVNSPTEYSDVIGLSAGYKF